MHEASHRKMCEFVRTYLACASNSTLEIIDLGAHSVDSSSTYRSLFDMPGWHYRGLDVVGGANVDIVVEDPYSWKELADSSVDVLVSGQTLEHIEYPWLTLTEIARVLRPGGVACLIAPASGPEHRFPVDCWRIYPDGMNALARYAGLKAVEVFTDWNQKRWKDSFAVMQKQHSATPADNSPFPAFGNLGVSARASTHSGRKKWHLSSLFRRG